MATQEIQKFLDSNQPRSTKRLAAVSLFSGAGLSDLGYTASGFNFLIQVELNPNRAALGKKNFPNSQWMVDDVSNCSRKIIQASRAKLRNERLDLLCLTPPCQGMSSSNPGRGKITNPAESDHRNSLLLESLPIIKALQPRILVAENVAPLLSRVVTWRGKPQAVIQAFVNELKDYSFFVGIIEMADYGIPQMRKRAIIVAIRNDEPIVTKLKAKNLLPWSRPTHAIVSTEERQQWVTLQDWLTEANYPKLDARTNPADEDQPLHFVPAYPEGDHRYEMIAGIPPNSGKNAYTNSRCLKCQRNSIPPQKAYCPHCGEVLLNRPVVKAKNGRWRLIKGFESSYRRASPNRPAPTVTTNSSHMGSDNKLHPWENRVMSTLECADLQTVPHSYDWSWALETNRSYLIRNVVGEALPPYFTYLHGKVIASMLDGVLPESKLSRMSDGQWRDVLSDNR